MDASNLELVLAPRVIEAEAFRGGQIAVIDHEACIGYGYCAVVCRFDAVLEKDSVYEIDAIACDGCAACVYHCPTEAIRMRDQVVGQFFR